ncbi:MAG: hypothetical protein B6D56_06560 [Candidatus Omnitrophica bacterium 4484_70.1]|nr:MAG: hypothetical protein B6D56_06560 [Candidatus Omnitrophica bacterium 4484_70.1]
MRKEVFFLFFFLSFSSLAVFSQNEKEKEAFYVAEKAFSDGFYSASQILFEKFIHNFPQSKRVFLAKFYLAKSLYFCKKYSSALKILEELKNLEEPQESLDELYYWLGKVYFRGKDYTRSRRSLEKIIGKFKESSYFWEAHYLLAENYLAQCNFSQAEKKLREIISQCKEKKIWKDSILKLLNIYYLQEDFASLENCIENYSSYFKNKEGESYFLFYKGEILYTKGDYKKALEVFRRGMKGVSQNFLRDIFYRKIGECLLKEKKFEKARANFEKIASSEIRRYSYINYYLSRENYTKALALIEEFLKRFPESEYFLYVYLDKAEVFYKLGRIKDALYIYQKISETPSVMVKSIKDKARYGIAWCYLKLGDFDRAIEEFKNILTTTDNISFRLSAQIQIADIYQEKGLYELALKNYNKILEEYPDNIYADYIQFQIGMLFLKNEKWEEAILSFRNLERRFPFSKLIPQANYYLATAYFSEGKYLYTQKILEKNWNRFGNTSLEEKARYLYGKCLFNQANYLQAIKIFSELFSKTKDIELKQLLLIDIAYSYINLSQEDKAREILEKFIIKFSYSEYLSSVLLNLGNLYFKEGKLKKAEKYYRRIIKKFPSDELKYEALLGIANIYMQEGRKDDSEQYLKEVIKEAPLVLRCKAKLLWADFLKVQGEEKKALRMYEEIIREGTSLASLALLRKAYLLKDLRRYSEAIFYFRKTLEKGIKNPEIYFLLGYCWEKLKDERSALDNYFKVIYLFEDKKFKTKAYFRIARIYERENRWKEARKIYEKLVALGIEESKIAQEKIKKLREKEGK